MKKGIDIHGISTTATYKDGDLLTCVNLRKKNGVHKPVAARKVIRSTQEQYVYEFQHNLPNTGENLIGVRNNNIYLVGESSETLITSTTGFKSITQIGNLLNVLDDSGIKIVFWVDSEYKVIETNFGGSQTATELLPVKVDLRVSGNTNEAGNRMVVLYPSKEINPTTYPYTPELREQYIQLAKGLYKKAIDTETKNGRLLGVCLVCTAIELYDGTYILHSSPVLAGMPWDTGTRYSFTGTDELEYSYTERNAGFKFQTNDTSSGLSLSSDDNITQYWVSISRQTGIYASNVQTEYPFIAAGTSPIKLSTDSSLHDRVVVFAASNKLQFKINQNISETYRNMIKSVSVFMTKQVHPNDYENIRHTSSYTISDASSPLRENYMSTPKTNSEILKELADNHQFYKVHEIPFEEIVSGDWVNIDLKDKLGDNLIMQEELPVDNFTHHDLLPNKQMVYNSKLHVMDYKQQLFHGWPYQYFEQKETGTGQFPTQIREVTAGGYPHWWAEVKIKTENGTTTVVRHKATQYGTWERNTYANTPMLSYPDSRAYEITLYIARFTLNGTSGFNKTTYKLIPSDTHNFAYYISPDLKPITYGIIGTPSNANPPETNRTLIYRNAMKVSSVNNPFYFPPETTYTIGTGIIRNGGTNAMQMSEGQYGQYDLFILTNEGTYSFDTGVEISYNRKAPASLIIPTSDIICSTPYGLVFIAARGIYLLNGQDPELLSPQIEEPPMSNNIVAVQESFITFLATVKDMLFNHEENELIIVSTTYDHNWIFNIDSKMWYISTEKIDFEVKNSSPSLLVVEDKKIKDYSQSETNIQTVSFLTRPIYVGIDEVKQLQRAILRAKVFSMNTMQNAGTPFYSLYGSNDSLLHTLLRGYNMPENKQDRTYKDFDSGILTRATYRNYSIGFMAAVDEKTEISHLELEITDNYDNDKLR